MGMHIRPVRERSHPIADTVFIDVNEKFKTFFTRLRIAKLDHFAKLPCGIHMKKGKSWRSRIKRLHRQMQHDGRILTSRREHHWIGKCCRNFSKDMDRRSFKPVKMSQILG